MHKHGFICPADIFKDALCKSNQRLFSFNVKKKRRRKQITQFSCRIQTDPIFQNIWISWLFFYKKKTQTKCTRPITKQQRIIKYHREKLMLNSIIYEQNRHGSERKREKSDLFCYFDFFIVHKNCISIDMVTNFLWIESFFSPFKYRSATLFYKVILYLYCIALHCFCP